jgi:hypothetical protein
MAKRTARPSPAWSNAHALYTSELAGAILENLMNGRSLADICREDGMPEAQTVRRWAVDDREGFAARFFQARRIGYARRAFDIADHALDALMTQRHAGGDNQIAPDRELIGHALLRIQARCLALATLPGVLADGESDPVHIRSEADDPTDRPAGTSIH